MEEKTPGPALFFLGFALGEDDLVDEEEDDHGYAAVEDGGADVCPRFMVGFHCYSDFFAL